MKINFTIHELKSLANFKVALDRLVAGRTMKPVTVRTTLDGKQLDVDGVNSDTGAAIAHMRITSATNLSMLVPHLSEWLDRIEQYNANIQNVPAFTATVADIDPKYLDPKNWVLTSSPCLFWQDGKMFNLLRLRHLSHKKPKRVLNGRTKADDLKIKVFFKFGKAEHIEFKNRHARNGLPLAQSMRHCPLDEEATTSEIAQFVMEGGYPIPVVDILSKMILEDNGLHYRIWNRPVNTTGCGEYETFTVMPMVKQAAKTKGRKSSNEDGFSRRVVKLMDNGEEAIFTQASGLALQDPKQLPGFLFGGGCRRWFFHSHDDPKFRYMQTKGGRGMYYSESGTDVPTNWDYLDPMDTFIAQKAAVAMELFMRGTADAKS